MEMKPDGGRIAVVEGHVLVLKRNERTGSEHDRESDLYGSVTAHRTWLMTFMGRAVELKN